MVKRILQKFRRDMHKLVILAILDSILYDSYAIYIKIIVQFHIYILNNRKK